jgi:transposase-like protein
MVRPGREPLRGVVEVDETFLGGERGGKRGRGAAGKALVAIAVEDTAVKPGTKGIGRVRMSRIADASSDSLLKFIRDNIEEGSTVRTDCWSGYSGVAAAGYKHEKVPGYGTVGEDLLPLVHRIGSLAKRWLLGTYQGAVKPQYLDYYLDEYTFRFNRRKSASRGKLFYRLIEQAVAVSPVSAHQIPNTRKISEYNL